MLVCVFKNIISIQQVNVNVKFIDNFSHVQNVVNVATAFPWVLWAPWPGKLIEPQFLAGHSEVKQAMSCGWGWREDSLGDWALSMWDLTLSQVASSWPEVTVRTGSQCLLQSGSLPWRNLYSFPGHGSLGFIFPSTPLHHLLFLRVVLFLGSQSKLLDALFPTVTQGMEREEPRLRSSQNPRMCPWERILVTYILCNGEGKLDYSRNVFQSNNESTFSCYSTSRCSLIWGVFLWGGINEDKLLKAALNSISRKTSQGWLNKNPHAK